MACIFPGSPDLAAFWSNIVAGVDAVRDVSDKEWEEWRYYDRDSKGFGKTYCKRGGFITEFAEFDPLKYGIMPSAVAGTDPDQLLALRVAQDALADAGYMDRPLNGDRAEVILGRISAPGAGSMNLIQQSKTVGEIVEIIKDLVPSENDELAQAVAEQLRQRLASCTSDNIPGVMPNILAGRIAAKLGFRGRNMIVDAACASSMVALETAVDDLVSRRCDFALSGGVYVNSSATMFNLFAGLGALSRSEQIRPFDAGADGTILGEGIGIVCLKRLDDALRDGDRIYATVCGVGSSSDGFGGSVIAPSVEGEALAIRRAYEIAGISPATVELLEAHGTATPAGDAAEMQAIESVFRAADNKNKQWCALGSVKSMIGHCQSASAIAGVIKAALSLYHKVLPPTLHVEQPNPKIDWQNHPCYINTSARPWLNSPERENPRRAGVSAFGFGGINTHAVLEEAPEHDCARRTSMAPKWDTELLTFAATTKDELRKKIEQVTSFIGSHPDADLHDIAFTVNSECQTVPAKESEYRLAIVCSTPEDAQQKLRQSKDMLSAEKNPKWTSSIERGIALTDSLTRHSGKVAFLYPGLGSAYTYMLADLCVHFPEVRYVFEIVDRVALEAGASRRPSDLIFPRDTFGTPGESTSLETADFAVVAVLLAEYAIFELLRQFEIKPDTLLGCSTGEFAAFTTGGAVDVLSAAHLFYRLSTDVGRQLPSDVAGGLASARVFTSSTRISQLAGAERIFLTADLGDEHTIVTAKQALLERFLETLRAERIVFQQLPNAIAYHTPLIEGLVHPSADIETIDVQPLAVPVWSCATSQKYPMDDADALRNAFTKLFAKPIGLKDTIRAMYNEGVRTFVEVGPNGVLSVLVRDILKDRPHVAVASNLSARSGITQLHQLLATLFANAVPVKFDYLYAHRSASMLNFDSTAAARPKKILRLEHTALSLDVSSLPTDQISFAPPAEESQDSVLQTYLQTNAQFFNRMAELQTEVMTAFLASEPGSEDLENDIDVEDEDAALVEKTADHAAGPAFLRKASIHRESGRTAVELSLDLAHHLYLLDHAIGGAIDSAGTRLHLVPLMVAIEMMAETAAVQAGSTDVVRIENVKAFRRLIVDNGGLTIKLVAHQKAADTVAVELLMDAEQQPAMSCEVRFNLTTVQPLRGSCLEKPAGVPVVLTSVDKLYTPGTMFHGPRMQAVRAIDNVGPRSIHGRMSNRHCGDWLQGIDNPSFIVNPQVLDNASQFVLFHLYEQQIPAKALLPFYIERIEIYRRNAELPREFEVTAQLNAANARGTEAVVEVSDGDGNIIYRVANIHSRQVSLSEELLAFVDGPDRCWLGKRIEVQSSELQITAVEQHILPQDPTVLDWLADYILTKQERRTWNELRNDKRRRDWLSGRVAAKEAIRRLLASIGHDAAAHDIEIHSQNEAPQVVLASTLRAPDVAVSLAHSAGVAVAIACFAEAGVPGIDIEQVSDRGPQFEETFLNESERTEVDRLDAISKQIRLTELWCVKEALYKAHRGTVEMQRFSAVDAAVTVQRYRELVLAFALNSRQALSLS